MLILPAYFVVDDCINERGTEGFVLMHGDPSTAIGTEVKRDMLLLSIKAYLKPKLKQGEVVYRVKLARRHGKHSFKPMAI